MKKLIRFGFLFSILISSVLAVDVGTISSKIDWDNSLLIVNGFVPVHKDGPDMDCFGVSYAYSDLTPWSGMASSTLFDLGFSSILSAGDLTLNDAISSSNACFRQAGMYTYHLKLVDNVGNETVGLDNVLIINPGLANQGTTSLEITGYKTETGSFTSSLSCFDKDLVANNTDKCSFLITLKDEFNNILEGRDFVAEIINQDLTGSYNTILNGGDSSEEAFNNGLRLEDVAGGFESGNRQKFNSTTDLNGQITFSLKALVPSLEIITGNISDYLMARLDNKIAGLDLKVENVDNEGTIIVGSETLLSGLSSSLITFSPHVVAQLSDNAPVGSPPIHTNPTEPLQFVFSAAKTFYVTIKSFSTGTLLPSANIGVFLKGYSPSPTVFVNENLSNGGGDINPSSENDGYKLDFSSTMTSASNSFVTELRSSGGIHDDLNVSFGSKIKYTVDGHDIVYPSGNLGNVVGSVVAFPVCNSSSIPECDGASSTASIIVGADIEGKIFTRENNYSFEDSSTYGAEIVKIGSIFQKDLRENLTQNVYEVVRGIDFVDVTAGLDFDISSDFGTDDIKYFKNGLVRIDGGSFQGGKRTIIIENGNLFITGNLSYADVEDSLGIILINSVVNDYVHGNIFIHKDVQKIVGTYFADGGFISSDVLVDATPSLLSDGVDVADRENTTGTFNKQLLLHGTFLTQNTLGGYLLGDLLTPYGKASDVTIGSYTDKQEAILYDIHFLRHYVPLDFSSSFVIDNPNCFSEDAINCDKNIHSFVVRPDGKVSGKTPPGFDGFSSMVR